MSFCTPLLPSIKDQAIGHMDPLTTIVCYLFVKVKQLVIFVCEMEGIYSPNQISNASY